MTDATAPQEILASDATSHNDKRGRTVTITLDIGPEIEAELAATARVRGLSAEQYARQVLEQALASATARRPLADRIREIWTDIPDEVRAKLPPDGASQHDHYIYGIPKRAE
jgi:hypothetical protein